VAQLLQNKDKNFCKAIRKKWGRIITCVKIIDKRIFLVSIYDKAERKTITKKEIESILKLSGYLQ